MDPPATSFFDIIHTTLGRLSNDEYSTVESLQTILISINNLPIESLTRYDNRINRIRKLIKGFNGPRLLTSRQKDTLTRTLIEISKTIIEKTEDKVHTTIYRHGSTTYFTSTTPSSFYRSDEETCTEKLTDDCDSAISQVIFTFIIDLSRDVMTSTLNTFVLEYFNTMELFLNENSERYSKIADDFAVCLSKHGWEEGFVKEPKIKDLVLDLENIANKYF
jgi:hypothetical protein